jgi:hypothetical protein
MQLALNSLQYLSTALAQNGQQDWMEDWLVGSWQVASSAASAANSLLQGVLDQTPTSGRHSRSADSTGSSSSSASRPKHSHASVRGVGSRVGATRDTAAAAQEVLQAEQTLQCICLYTIMPSVTIIPSVTPCDDNAWCVCQEG